MSLVCWPASANDWNKKAGTPIREKREYWIYLENCSFNVSSFGRHKKKLKIWLIIQWPGKSISAYHVDMPFLYLKSLESVWQNPESWSLIYMSIKNWWFTIVITLIFNFNAKEFLVCWIERLRNRKRTFRLKQIENQFLRIPLIQ